MKQNSDKIIALILKFLKGKASATEKKEIDSWRNGFKESDPLYPFLNDFKEFDKAFKEYESYDEEQAWIKVLKESHPPRKSFHLFVHLRRYAAIAILFLFISALALYELGVFSSPSPTTEFIDLSVVKPLSAATILVNENGDTTLLNQNVLSLEPVDAEDTAHEPGSKLKTLYVPKGNIFELALSDGSTVWINGGSVVRFSEVFSKDERHIELVGEAYFDVKQSSKPFRVHAPDGVIEVLGTSFNVKTMPDYTLSTLVTGKIKINTLAGNKILLPGEQSKFNEESILISEVDTKKYTSWHLRLFYFDDDSLKEIFRTLAEWYDIDMQIHSDVDLSERYTGVIGRDLNLKEVVDILNFSSQYNFQLTSDKILHVNKNN